MSTEQKDTITVELPFEARRDGHVNVAGAVLSREYWRKVAASPRITLNDLVREVAPAVVAWIERDEWKPLPIPEVGRKIQATLRNGHVETFEVRKTDVAPDWASVWKAGPSGGVRYIQRVRDVGEFSFVDIIAWEYMDEPAETIISAEQLSAMAQFIEEQFVEDRCWCQSCGSGDEHVRKLLAKAGLTVAGGE